jgi:hypothetical protein
MVEGRYKLMGGLKWRLFELVGDPGEIRPLQGERPDLVSKMRDKLSVLTLELQNTQDSLAEGEDEISVTLDEDARRRLEALGYLK